jgi:hypothetical protein
VGSRIVIMESVREQLMSLVIYCSCSPHPTRMTVSEYCDETLSTWEAVIYECSLCGKRKRASYRDESLFTWERIIVRDC